MHYRLENILQQTIVAILIILINVAHSLAAGQQTQSSADLNLLNARVHASAQASIGRLLNGSIEQRHIAKHLYESIENGALAGIYPVNHKLPALRGMWIGKRWQTLLQNKPARCWKQPEGYKPIILLDPQIITDPGMLDIALIDAYYECGFRELDVVVKKQISDPYIPCVGEESSVFIYSPVTGVLIDPACQTDERGVCHLALPPAIYLFEVSCNDDPTSPEVIFRSIKKGKGVQIEGFNNLFWMPQYWENFKNQD